jgi:hypothetical protein
MNQENRTQYRVILPGAAVFYRPASLGTSEDHCLLGNAENVSLGGLFIGSRRPLRPGTFVRLQLFSPADPEHSGAVYARGVVRWRQLWREPRGMGVQFLEFEGLGERVLETWLETVTAPAVAAPAPASLTLAAAG